MSIAGLALKRAFDTGLSGVLLLVFSPVLAICAAAIKMEDGGPVIFRQERIGRDGKPFTIFKLRSMRIDAEANGEPALFQGADDSRLTKTGRFLRNHHLDELPQLYNVFRGDMSFIGHRPERKFYIDQIMARDPRYRYLYQIRPGVTSYATLYNGYTDTLEKMLTRLDLDLYYLRNRSVWFDIKVLGLTFLSIVSGKRF
ncbi:MAG: sugar transferase [Bacteroidales bacterium]|nr:sugar transferase [Bacteroidales bacterium]